MIPEDVLPELLQDLYSAVMKLYLKGYTHFICGGAVGFDTLAADCVLAMRERFPEITLSLFLPCRDQTQKWNSLTDLKKYKEILGKADEVRYVTDFYTEICMHERNRLMADFSDVCVAYMRTARGGTAYTVKYANSRGLTVINLCDPHQQLTINDN